MSDADRIAEVTLPLIHAHCAACIFADGDDAKACEAMLGKDDRIQLCWWAALEKLICSMEQGEN